MTVTIRCVFGEDNKLYPQVFLDGPTIVQLVKMLKYDRIDISEGIDLDKTNKSRECKFCHYWYYLNKNLSYCPFTCDGCYDIVQKSTDFKNIAIIHFKVYFKDISKNKAKRLMNRFNLVGKTGDIYCND